MVRQEALEERGLASRWQDEVGLVYSLPQELIDQLDGRIDELEAGMSGAGTSGANGRTVSDEDEDEDESNRDRHTEVRAAVTANQQTLLVQLQRGQGARVQLRHVQRTDYSRM